MNTDGLRATFEAHMPLPAGVRWDGDFLHGTHGVIGSHRNATEWSAMWRGFKLAHKVISDAFLLSTPAQLRQMAHNAEKTKIYGEIMGAKELVTPEPIKIHIHDGKFVALESTKGPTK